MDLAEGLPENLLDIYQTNLYLKTPSKKKSGGKIHLLNLQPWKDRMNFNTVVAIILLVFSIIVFILIPYEIEKPRLLTGRSLSGLTPSLFPRLSVVGLFILSVCYLVFSPRMVEKNLFKELKAKSLVRVLVTVAVFMVYALLFEPLGFILSSALVVCALTLYYGNRNILIMLLVVVGAPLAIYFIFTHILQVSLPEGLLF
jgi:putative tricarboxylic transport membrane protein